MSVSRVVMTVLVPTLWVGCVRLGFDTEGHGDQTRPPGDGPLSDLALDTKKSSDGPDGSDGKVGPDAPGDTRPQDSLPDLPPGDTGSPTAGWVQIKSNLTFKMGSPASEACRVSFNEDQHQVTLSHPFEIQATEVTQAQFQQVMGYNPANHKSCGAGCPVEMVSWHEAAAYCNLLSAKAGLTACYACSGSRASASCAEAAPYSGNQIYACPGYRLPTEAEWELAYRAGTATAYHSGSNLSTTCTSFTTTDPNADLIAWYSPNAGGTTHAVSLKKANAWGLFDMAGNVWEWCHDPYQQNLGTANVVDPVGAGAATSRVSRGGSFVIVAQYVRAAARISEGAANRYDDEGFRCSRTLP